MVLINRSNLVYAVVNLVPVSLTVLNLIVVSLGSNKTKFHFYISQILKDNYDSFNIGKLLILFLLFVGKFNYIA